MIKQDKLYNELSNWEHFLIWLNKINLRASKTPKLTPTDRERGKNNEQT
jgi:hypothetical protein